MNDQLESICKRMNKIKKEKKNKGFKSFLIQDRYHFLKKNIYNFLKS